ncbi:UspA [Dillenia turbinata]|uniref:UspA n=1 Tax=Dillenia turbinata TaxID=194707 RepID=A0AAN8V1P5_9MAGN
MEFAGSGEKKVMVAIDESEDSYYALLWVLDNLGDSASKTPLIIFNAQPPPNYHSVFAAALGAARMYTPVSATPEFINSMQEQERKVSMGLLEKAKTICASRGIKAETRTEIGDPKVAILNAVNKYNVNLLVLGNHGISKLKRAFIGSVSNYCVQNAKCPVLVVKRPE